MSFLEIKNINKTFGKVDVLKDISINLDRGKLLVLVGPSGCGKSTLLNIIAGVESITSGDIELNGRKINDLHPSKRDIAMVFQSYALYPTMNVRDNISFGLEMRKVPKAERYKAVDKVAKILRIEDLLDRKPRQLSGGQRQRVAMGRALVRDPHVFLFDEPLSNLDARLRVEMRSEIKQLHLRLGATMVYVTHDQVEAMTLADVIVILKDGYIQQIGTPAEVYNKPQNLFVADFMGSPPMNLLHGHIKSGAVEVEKEDGKKIQLPLPKNLAGKKNAKVILGLRPEMITDPATAVKSAKITSKHKFKVNFIDRVGADNFAFISLGETTICGRLGSGYPVSLGGDAEFVFNMDNAVLFTPEGERLT